MPVWPFLAHPIPSLNPYSLLPTPPHPLAPCVWFTAVHGCRVCPVEGIARESTVPVWYLGVMVNRDCKLNRIYTQQGAWACLQGDVQTVLTEVGKSILNMVGTISPNGVPDWIIGRKQALTTDTMRPMTFSSVTVASPHDRLNPYSRLEGKERGRQWRNMEDQAQRGFFLFPDAEYTWACSGTPVFPLRKRLGSERSHLA